MDKRIGGGRIGIEEDTELQKIIGDVRGLLFELYGKRTGRNWSDVKAETRLCTSTISNFAMGLTRSPSVNTIKKLAGAVGYKFRLVNVQTGKVVEPGQHFRKSFDPKAVQKIQKKK